MTPVVANPSASFEDIIRGIDHSDEASSVKKYVNQLIGKLQRRAKNITKQDEDYFLNLQKITPQEFIQELKEQPLDKVKTFIQNHKKAIEFLFHSKSKSNHYKIISDKTDQITERYQGYGGAEQRPEDYIEEFRTFITENQNRIAALNILCTRPKELTRNELKSLRLEMEQVGYSIKEINHAWNKAKNVDITTDIIGIVRTLALGSALVDYSVRLENAFKKLKAHRQFTKIEEK